MDTKAEREQVRAAVRKLLEADHAAGVLKDLVEYKKPFPGYWDIAAEEYEKFVGEMKGTQAPPAGAGDTVKAVKGELPPIRFETEAPPVSSSKEERIGPYRLLKELGRGGMGVVYLAEDTRIKRRVALKMLSPQFASSSHLLMRFRREAEVASRIEHPGICAVYDADVDGEVPYIAMRLVEGKTLQEWIAVSKAPTGELPQEAPKHTVTRLPGSQEEPAPAPAPADTKALKGKKAATTSGIHKREEIVRVIHLMEKAARALHVAHEAGLIHRDIKPGNIMVTAEGEPILLDFGLARSDDEEGHQLTQTGSLMGTPAYMSPEQLTAARIKLDRRTDIYSLGATLYECLTLRLPFEAPTLEALYQKILATDPDNARKVNPSIPDDLRVVLETALEKDRDRRYQSALDFAEDLRRVRGFEPIRAKPVGPLTRLARWAQRSPAMAAALGALLLTLTTGLAMTTYLLGESRAALRRSRIQGILGAWPSSGREDPMVSLLLLREAVTEPLHPEVYAALHDALDLSPERARIPGLSQSALAGGTDTVLTVSQASGATEPASEIVVRDIEGQRLTSLVQADPVWGFGVSRDGKRVWTFSEHKGLFSNRTESNTLGVWDMEGRRVFSTDGTTIGRLWFSPRGDWLASLSSHPPGASSLEIKFLGMDGATPAPNIFPPGSSRWGVEMDFLEDPLRVLIATTEKDGPVRLSTVAPGDSSIEHHIDLTRSAAGTKAGTPPRVLLLAKGNIAFVRYYPDAWLVDTRTWSSCRLQSAVGQGQADLSSDGTRVLMACEGRKARLWNREGELLLTLDHGDSCEFVALSKDSKLIATAGSHCIRLWDSKGTLLRTFLIDRSAYNDLRSVYLGANGVNFGDSGRTLFARLHACDDKGNGLECAAVWSLEREGSRSLDGVAPPLESAQFTPRGEILTTNANGEIRLGGFEGPPAQVLAAATAALTKCVAVSSTGDLFLLVGNDGSASVVRRDGSRVAGVGGPEEPVVGGAFTESGDLVALAGDHRILSLDLRTGERSTLPLSDVDTTGAVPLGRGDRILVHSRNRPTQVWTTAGKCLATIGTGPWNVGGSPQTVFGMTNWVANRWAVTAEGLEERGRCGVLDHVSHIESAGSGPGFALLTDTGDADVHWLGGPESTLLRGHRGALRAGCFSPDGSRFVAVGEDGVGALWSRDGKQVGTLRFLEGHLLGVTFDGAGKRVLGVSDKGEVRSWFANAKELLAFVNRRITRELTPGERTRYADLLEPVPGTGK